MIFKCYVEVINMNRSLTNLETEISELKWTSRHNLEADIELAEDETHDMIVDIQIELGDKIDKLKHEYADELISDIAELRASWDD